MSKKSTDLLKGTLDLIFARAGAVPGRDTPPFQVFDGRDLHAIETEPGGIVDHVLDRRPFAAEVPVRIARDRQLDRARPDRRRRQRLGTGGER